MKLIEKRQLYSFELKRLCAKNRLFDLGSGKEYEILLGMTKDEHGNMKNLSTQDIQRIAEYIISRSELPSGISLTNVASVINNACDTDFKLVESDEEQEVLQSKLPAPSRYQIPYTHPSISRLRPDGSIETVVIGSGIPSDTQELMDLLAALPEDARRTAQIAIRALIAGLTDRSIAGDSLSLRTGSERLATANE